jgi:uncharacterized protein YjbI with pentapeptide repeats
MASYAEIKANPSILNGRSIDGAAFKEGPLILENLTLSNTTFNKIKSSGFSVKNVVFANCSFIDCAFYDGDLENVIFKGGVISNSRTRYIYGSREYRPDWGYVTVKNVVFDGVSMRNAILHDFYHGKVTFKNMSDFRDYAPGDIDILRGEGLKVRIDNCHLGAYGKAVYLCSSSSSYDQYTTIYITNSKFSNGSGLGGNVNGSVRAVYIDNCEFTDHAALSYFRLMVVKNSTLNVWCVDHEMQGNFYFVNNKYVTAPERDWERGGTGETTGSAIDGKNVYFINDGGGMKSAAGDAPFAFMPIFLERCRRVDIYNADVYQFKIGYGLAYLNLRNVRILGGDWGGLELTGGQWENVEIHGLIKTNYNPQFGDLKCYNLSFQPPPPLRHFNYTGVKFSEVELGKLSNRSRPFAWPAVPVPTLQEMGIEPD